MKNTKSMICILSIFSILVVAILPIVFGTEKQIYKLEQIKSKVQTTQENSIGSLEGQILVENYNGEYNAVISAYLTSTPETVTERVTSDPNGNFVMYFADTGEYNITIEQAGTVMYKGINLKIENDQKLRLLNAILINGDVNGDNEVEIMDLSNINNNFSIIIDENNKKYDLNKDGKIDEVDRNIIKNSYGKKTSAQLAEYEEVEGYGIKRAISSSTSTWNRVGDSEGLIANATKSGVAEKNDFDKIYPWSEIKSYNYDTTNKIITAWYGESNFSFDGSNGEVLTYIPEFYYKRIVTEENGTEYEYNYISRYPLDGYTKSPAFSVGRYKMSENNGVAHSISGVLPSNSKTINSFRTIAKAVGTEFTQMDYRYFILQMLYLVEYADYDAQSSLGMGWTNTSSVQPTGYCDGLGMKSGSVGNGTSGTEGMIYRGIEDFYGNTWEFVDGINIKNNVAWICKNPEQYGTEIFQSPYYAIGYVNATSSNYISQLGYDEDNSEIAFPVQTLGSYNQYMCDNYWQISEDCIAYVGGGYSSSVSAGPWCWHLGRDSSTLSIAVGSRLIKYQ